MKGEMSDAVTRRNFLLGSGGAALFSMVGCEQVEKMFSQGPKEGPVVPPSGEGIDLVSHVVNRLSFGPTPSEYARVKGLAKTEEEAAISYIEEQLDAEGIDDKRTIRAVRRFEAIHAPLVEMYEYKEEFLLEQMTQATLVRATQSKRQLYEVERQRPRLCNRWIRFYSEKAEVRRRNYRLSLRGFTARRLRY
ncbi:DUF1800 family protein [Akkermansiaceae bacterium]|nr:DUF1800 family protein [Akkermansiaceae bacterium]